MEAEPVPPSRWKAFAVPLLLVLLVALGMTTAGFLWGKSEDCRPGEIDGQCGMGTAFGTLVGLGGGVLTLFAGLASVLFAWDNKVRLYEKRRDESMR